MAETAYDRAMKHRVAVEQAAQRNMPPIKVGQKILRAWCGSHQAVMDPFMAADLVKMIEAAIVAERAALPSGQGRS